MAATPSRDVELDKVRVTIRLVKPGPPASKPGTKPEPVPVSPETAAQFIATLLLKPAIEPDKSDDPAYEEKFKQQKFFSKQGECVFELRETNKHSWVYVEGRERQAPDSCLVGWECSFGKGIRSDMDVSVTLREDKSDR